MGPKKLTKLGPEKKIQNEIIEFLTLRQWFVMTTHGNIFQYGFPDLYATHYKHGTRWIEIKNPKAFSFTPAQMEFFPKLLANGTRIWILTEATEQEYKKLFLPCNCFEFMLRKL